MDIRMTSTNNSIVPIIILSPLQLCLPMYIELGPISRSWFLQLSFELQLYSWTVRLPDHRLLQAWIWNIQNKNKRLVYSKTTFKVSILSLNLTSSTIARVVANFKIARDTLTCSMCQTALLTNYCSTRQFSTSPVQIAATTQYRSWASIQAAAITPIARVFMNSDNATRFFTSKRTCDRMRRRMATEDEQVPIKYSGFQCKSHTIARASCNFSFTLRWAARTFKAARILMDRSITGWISTWRATGAAFAVNHSVARDTTAAISTTACILTDCSIARCSNAWVKSHTRTTANEHISHQVWTGLVRSTAILANYNVSRVKIPTGIVL